MMSFRKKIRGNTLRLSGYPQALVAKKVREKAVLATKARLVENHKTFDDYTDEQLEVIIADEERKIIDDLKTKSLVVVLAALGLNIFV